MKILLTGATGFIGRHLIQELARSHRIYAVTRGTAAPSENSNVEWIEHDLARAVPASFPPQVDAVVHLAQSAAYRQFPQGAQDVFAVNVQSTFALLEYARQASARSFVLASTGGVYDYSATPIDEHGAVALSAHYFRSKYAAEILMQSYSEVMSTIALRFFFVYGPGQRGMLVPRLVERIRAGKQVSIEGDPGIAINPIHVEDAIRVVEPALRREGSEVFNVAGDEAVSIRALVDMLAELCATQARVVHVDSARNGDLVASNARMRDELGVTPSMTLRAGLRGVVDELLSAALAARSSRVTSSSG